MFFNDNTVLQRGCIELVLQINSVACDGLTRGTGGGGIVTFSSFEGVLHSHAHRKTCLDPGVPPNKRGLSGCIQYS